MIITVIVKTMATNCILVILTCVSLILQITSYELSISPDHVDVPWNSPTPVVVTCTTNVPLTACQFTWRSYWGGTGPLLDLTLGPRSRPDPAHLNGTLRGYAYSGRGLDAGQCGVRMEVYGANVWMVGCRVRAGTYSNWKYAWMDLTSSVSNSRPSSVSIREAIVLPGGVARFVMTTQTPLKDCHLFLPAFTGYIDFKRGVQFTGRHRYLGAGLQRGECGLTLTDITEADNGPVNVYAASSTGFLPYNRFVVIIVARRPSQPLLRVRREGTELTATCEVHDGRPTADLTWFLGDDVIRRDTDDDSVAEPRGLWRWPWMVGSTMQTVTLSLRPEHDGKFLKCSVSHVTMNQTLEVFERISFTDPSAGSCPQLTSETIDISCSYEGQPISCSRPQRTGSSASLSCKTGFRTNSLTPNITIHCFNSGEWDRPTFTCVPVTCAQLISETVDISCLFGGQPISCTQPQRAGSMANLVCKIGFQASDDVINQTIHCLDSGEWDGPVFACSPETCPPLSSDTVDVTCLFGGQPVSCRDPQRAGSMANLVCKTGFTVKDEVIYRTIHCLASGKWDRLVFTCIPDCGKRKSNSGQTLIAGGEVMTVGEFPWHVAVYEVKSDRSHTLICSGSLVSPKIVITAAHCYWNSQYDEPKNASLYRVAAGKHKRAWMDGDDGSSVQRRGVVELHIPTAYHGRRSTFQSDVALLRLATPVDITADVNIVCVDWGNQWERAQLTPGSNGSVVGWGYTETGVLSEELRKVDLPTVDYQTCYRALDDNLKPMLTLDKFCAGYVNRSTSTCRGDSGGGLVYRLPGVDKHYIRGVVSIAFTPFANRSPCYSQLYTAFTLVSQYHAWIREQL